MSQALHQKYKSYLGMSDRPRKFEPMDSLPVPEIKLPFNEEGEHTSPLEPPIVKVEMEIHNE